MTAIRSALNKSTIQAVLAFTVTITACYLAVVDKIGGETVLALALLAFGWAFRQASDKPS